ncbi:Exportin-2 [Ordospora colligata]
MALLKSGNEIAFTYMKMKCKEWCNIPERVVMMHSMKNELFSLIFESSELNFGILCFFFETLYFQGAEWNGLVQELCARHDRRCLKILNHMFNKYRTCTQSNELYTEIIENIELCRAIFSKAYFESISEDENVLGMFYSLIFQDIHPFFEDNADKFMASFCALFRKHILQKEICEIFNLFVTKYAECIDMTRILGVLLVTITRFDRLKYSVLLNIAKRKEFSVLSKFSDALCNAVKIGAYLSPKEIEEMNEDALLYTRNLLKGYDMNREMVIELIGHLRKVFGECWCESLVSVDVTGPMDEERLVFLCMGLRMCSREVIDRCIVIISTSSVPPYLGAIAFRYLLMVQEYSSVDPRYISRMHPASFLAIEYLSRMIDADEFLRSLDTYSKEHISSGYGACERLGGTEYYKAILDKLIEFISGGAEDEISCKLIHRIARMNISLITPEAMKFVDDLIERSILSINSPQGYWYLLDVKGIALMRYGDDGSVTEIVQRVLSEEIFEIYAPSFFLLGVLVCQSPSDFSSVVEIIKQESLWKTKELVLSMVCLTICLFERGYCSKEQVRYIVEYLLETNAHQAYVLLCGTIVGEEHLMWIKGENVDEEFVLATLLSKKGVMTIDMYRDVYIRSVKYFEENFVSKQNARRVLMGLRYGKDMLREDESARCIIEKNKRNLGYENVPFSTMITFGI